jgi:aryl-alcohol dehydrogenase-like predicted oxidoreductase
MDMGDGKIGLKPAYIRQAVDDSLRRLQVDCIDLYQSHKDDEATPQEATLEAYARLIESGKVRAIGASNFTAPRLAQALEISHRDGLPRYESLQPLYNLYDRAPFEPELQTLCVDNEVGAIGYFSLAAGFLTGKYRTAEDASKSKRGKGVVDKYLNARGLRILAALDSVASQHRSTPARVALAWTMTRPGVAAPIASATSLEQLRDIMAAVELVLDAESMAQLDAASAPE